MLKQLFIDLLRSTQPFRFIGKSIRNLFVPSYVPASYMSDHPNREIYIEVSNICNAKCVFCNYRLGYRTKKIMDVPAFLKIAQECISLGYRRLNLTSMGGELFAHPDAIAILRAAKSAGFEVIETYTNGILLSRFDLNALLDSGLTKLSISFPGFDREEYKLIFGVDKYDEFLESLLKLLELNHMSANKLRIELQPRSRSSLAEIRNSSTFKNKIAPFLSENVCLVQPIAFYDTWGGEIRQSELPKGLRLEINPIKSIYPIRPVNLCSKLSVFGILANGDVRLCGCRYDSTIETSDELILDNLRNHDSLHSLLHANAEKIEAIRSDFTKGKMPGVCRKCAFYMPIKIKPPAALGAEATAPASSRKS